MTDQKPLTEQQLTDIEARATATPDGPWALSDDLDGDGYPGHLWVVRTPASGPDEPDEHSAVVSIGNRALGEFVAAARTDVPALLAEVRRLRAELDEMTHCRDSALRALYRDDVDTDIDLEETIGAPFYGPGWDWDENDLQRVVKEAADAVRPAFGKLTQQRDQAQAALEEIRHLHKDSPMGPCPVCIDADAAAAGGDGLVPYPCPTGRLAGAQDCDPPHVRAAAATAEGAQR